MRLVSRSNSTMTYSAPGSAAAVAIPITFTPKYRRPGGSAGNVRSHAPASLPTVLGGRAVAGASRAYAVVRASPAWRHENTASAAPAETNTGGRPIEPV